MVQVMKYAVFVVILAVVIILLYLVVTGRLVEYEKLEREAFLFTNLCNEWVGLACTPQGLNAIDRRQLNKGELDLTYLCWKLHNLTTSADLTGKAAAVENCEDICKNSCNEVLYYDLAVYPQDIQFGLNNLVNISINNVGTGTVRNAIIKIIDVYANTNITPAKVIPKIRPKETAYIPITTGVRTLRIEILTEDQNPFNNEAENK